MAKFYANYVSAFPDIKKDTFVLAVVASSLITYFAYSYLLVRLTFNLPYIFVSLSQATKAGISLNQSKEV